MPTFAEQGLTGQEADTLTGIVAPAGTPKEMLEKIAADVRAIASEPSFRDRNFIQRGIEPVLNGPDEFAVFLKDDRARAKRVVEQAGIRIQ